MERVAMRGVNICLWNCCFNVPTFLVFLSQPVYCFVSFHAPPLTCTEPQHNLNIRHKIYKSPKDSLAVPCWYLLVWIIYVVLIYEILTKIYNCLSFSNLRAMASSPHHRISKYSEPTKIMQLTWDLWIPLRLLSSFL